jgi:hypothetical protein
VSAKTRSQFVAVLLGGCLFLLTGCFKADVDLEVHADNTVSGTLIAGVDKAYQPQLDAATPDQWAVLTGSLPKETKSTAWSDGSYVGKKMSFEDVPLDKFGSASTLKRDGETFVFNGNMDLSTIGTLPTTPDVSLTIKFPGPVIESNGDIDGNTVTWHPQPGNKNVMTAVASDHEKPNGLAGVLGVLGALIGTIGLVGLAAWYGAKKKAARSVMGSSGDSEDATGEPVIDAANPEPTPPSIPAGWYPTADGTRLRWHDGTQWTAHTRVVTPSTENFDND